MGTGSPDEPAIASTRLGLDAADVGSAERLVVLCHRCGNNQDAPEFEPLAKPIAKVKASLRIVGGDGNDAPWIDVTDTNVQLDDVSRAHGGINGGLVTTTFSIALDAQTRARLVGLPGTNRIEFRFNGTDGNSNGFRILDVQLRNAAGTDLNRTPRKYVDIGAEKEAGKAWSDDAAKGQALWHGKDLLIKSPVVPRKIHAACDSCHAEDGRDLQYFNYSNNSIVQRSKFHGLSDEQGKQIAAYLRASLHDKVPHVPAAAPENPPYQPGPGMDSKPVIEWAAGAGLRAVLPDGKAFMKAFVGQPVDDKPLSVTQAELDRAMDPKGKLNTREMPVPLQFPDWNAWLPNVHPLDIWTPDQGQSAGLFETAAEDKSPLKTLAKIKEFFEANKNKNGVYGDWSHLTPEQRERIQQWFYDFGARAIGFAGGGRGDRQSSDPSKPYGGEIGGAKLQALLSKDTAALAPAAAFSKQAFIERALVGLFHWMGVKQWQLAHTYGLEGDQSYFHGKKDGSKWIGEGDKRGWIFTWPSVFYLAPHMLYAPEDTAKGKREFYFSWEPRLVSYFRTNQWYQLQMTINPGWSGASQGPMDWPYHLGFTTGVVDDLETAKAPTWVSAAHLARFFQVRAKISQLANTNISFNTPDPQEPDNLFKNTGIQSRADFVYKLAPTGILHTGPDDWQRTRFRHMDVLQAGLHKMLVNTSIGVYNDYFANTTAEQWRRCDPNAHFGGEQETKSGFRFCLDKERTPLPTDKNGKPYLAGGWVDWTIEQYIAWGILAAKQIGADPQRIATWSDWHDRMWP
ncbi:hypothetical protein LZC95_03690 [Pendulispora brunnea]|uniref:Cytochrome c domain-containing protein n=1 Tax=Pendulispora brunnea TaxID=2905690 RepID=A0ABZ2KBC7_9BACT